MEENQDEKRFTCGVVEGFYGRPWTMEQRKNLFKKLKKCGMDSYVYAPKDDYKHRAYWRELYTVEEAEHLTNLITAAKKENILFYYALSPGLDMTYSNPKEVSTLKRKLDQVSQFGCEAFALLFDDIEPEMSKADKEVFQSFGHAQVTVTNEVYNHLDCSRFLFCPTQYCSTRAQPTVISSEYLNTIGSKLIRNIDILWTGPKVISKNLSLESIQEISEVLCRPPIIWDNLHANDYDQKRVFLGPYSGRSTELIPFLRGVLTNPNCEYHANQIAIHTLAYWSKCNSETPMSDSISADARLETEIEDGIRDEDVPNFVSKNVYHPRIALRTAISEWIPEFYENKQAWGPISKPQPQLTMVLPTIPILPSINTCMSLTTSTISLSSSSMNFADGTNTTQVNTTQLQTLAEVCSTVNSVETVNIAQPVMNSLASPNRVITDRSISNQIPIPIQATIPIAIGNVDLTLIKSTDMSTQKPDIDTVSELHNNKIQDNDETEKIIDDSLKTESAQIDEDNPCDSDIDVIDSTQQQESSSSETISAPQCLHNSSNKCHDTCNAVTLEPMDCASVPATSPKAFATCDVVMKDNISTSSTGSMQLEVSDNSPNSNFEMSVDEKCGNDGIAAEDLFLLCDLFYLPFEHGSRSLKIIHEFHWLKSNSVGILSAKKCPTPESQEWFQRAEKFYDVCQTVLSLAKKLALCSNKELCYDLFAYVWDVTEVIILLRAFVKWLAIGHFSPNIESYTQSNFNWFSKGWRDSFSSGDQEPWVFRGGLTADLQRLIPIDAGNDLFNYKMPDVPSPKFFITRPYAHTDDDQLNIVCRKTCSDGSDCSQLFPLQLQSMPADRLVGPFITIHPEYCFVLQNENDEIVGYACAAPNVKQFYESQEMCWFPEMRLKYPLSLIDSSDSTPVANECIKHFHNYVFDYPVDVLNSHSAIVTCCLLKELYVYDQTLPKRLITLLFAALRANGYFSVHVCINSDDKYLYQFYLKLGFGELYEDVTHNKTFLGRTF